MGTPSGQRSKYDYSFKIVIIGDSNVGKSSLLVSFLTGAVTDLPNTLGVDIKMKEITLDGKRLKLTIWDTAGQEKFRSLTSTYYKGADGIILAYDVTRKQTFTNLANLWTKEVELYSTNKDCVKILVGNKVDRESERVVSREEGIELAKQNGFLFLEASAKTRENVEKCFEDLALKMLKELEKKRPEDLEKKLQEELKLKPAEAKVVLCKSMAMPYPGGGGVIIDPGDDGARPYPGGGVAIPYPGVPGGPGCCP